MIFFSFFVLSEHVLTVELRLSHHLCGCVPLVLHLQKYRFLISGGEKKPQ